MCAAALLSLFPIVVGAATPAHRYLGTVPQQRTNKFLAQRSLDSRHAAQSPAALLAQAKAAHHDLAVRPNLQNVTLSAPWQSIGPSQVSTSTYGLVTGRITSIAADPSDTSGNTVYIGTTGGGVWKSLNAAGAASAVTFTPLTDNLNDFTATQYASLSIGALTVQPGGTGVILAGTGDPNDASDSYYGEGILRSTNNGLTWSLISTSTVDLAHSGYRYSFVGSAFSGFAWSTTNPNLVVAAVTDTATSTQLNVTSSVNQVLGIYYSQDAGQSWQLATITDGTSTTIIQAAGTSLVGNGNAATSIVWNPIRQRFYAAIRYHGYYESTDGITWTRLTSQPAIHNASGNDLNNKTFCPANPGLPASSSCPIYRGVVTAQPVTGDLFALTVDVNNLDQGLWQDTCNKTSGACSSSTVAFSTQIADAALEAAPPGDTTIPQADYDLYLAAVPSQQDTLLFVGTADIYRCSLVNSCVWRNTTNTANSGAFASAKVAPWQHVIDATFYANSLLYFGNDGGLWRTTDDVNQPACCSDDANHFQNLNGGLGSLAEVESISGDPGNPQTMLAALGFFGTAATTTGSTGTWNQVLDGTGNEVAVDPNNPNLWYATSEFGIDINRCAAGAACDATGFGAPVIGSVQVGGDVQSIPAPWILDPQNPANMLVGTCRVWRGPATGAGWAGSNLLSDMLDGYSGPFCDSNAEIRSLAATGSSTDPAGTAERIYAGMAGLYDGGFPAAGHIFSASVTDASDATTSWTDLTRSTVTNDSNLGFNDGEFDISSVYADPHDASGKTVYVTIQGFTGHGRGDATVYRSMDGGATWQNINSNLPLAPKNSILVDPNDANTVYLAGDTGVYATTNVNSCSDNTQNCWSVFGTSLPNVPVTQLTTFNEGSTSVLRAATYGRGIWQIGLLSAGTVRTTATVSPAVLTFGDQALQTQSVAQTVTVTNTGTFTLNVASVGISGDFAEQDTCGQPVLPGASCAVQVTFDPSQIGDRTGTLTLYGNLTNGGQIAVSLDGTGVSGAAVTLTPQALSFPATLVGATATTTAASTSPLVQNIVIANTGGVSVALTSESITGDFAISSNTCGSSLASQHSCAVGITFTPTASGIRTGTLMVADGVGIQTVLLTGTGLAPATDILAPLSLTFAQQQIGTVSASQQVMLTNHGDESLQAITITVAGPFTAANTCGADLQGHASCAITVSYVPSQIGAETGTLTVSDNKHTNQTVTLAGTGLAPAGASMTPASFDFGPYSLGRTSNAQPVTITNNGGSTLTGLTYAMSGDFVIATNSCSTTLAVGASCQIGVVFSPTQTGTRTGTLTASASNLTAAFNTSLTGIGEDFSIQINGSSTSVLTSGQSATFQVQIAPVGNSSGPVSLACTGAPQGSTCSLSLVTVTLNPNNTTGTVTLTIQTSTTTTAWLNRKGIPGWEKIGFALAALLPIGWIGRHRRWVCLYVLTIVGVMIPLGCGVHASGVNSGGGSGTSNTITITGTAPGGLQHSTTVTLTVE